jgi:hypothetical protein
MKHVYIAEVDDGWSQNPYVIGASLSLEPLKERILELYPDAISDGDDYTFRSGTIIRINVEVWALL